MAFHLVLHFFLGFSPTWIDFLVFLPTWVDFWMFLPTWVDFWMFLPTWIHFCMILPTWVNFWAFFPHLSWFRRVFYLSELISERFLPTWINFWAFFPTWVFFTHLSWFLGVFSPTWVDFWPPDDPGNEALYLGGHPHPDWIHLQPHLDGFTKMADDGCSLKTPQRSHFFLKHARIHLVLSIFVDINWKA